MKRETTVFKEMFEKDCIMAFASDKVGSWGTFSFLLFLCIQVNSV